MGADLRTGKLEFVRRGLMKDVRWMAARQGNLVLLGNDGLIAALSMDGTTRLWEMAAGKEYQLACGAGSDLVCLGGPEGSVLCIDARSGGPVWKTSVEGKLLKIWCKDDSDDLIVADLLRDGQNVVAGILAKDGSLRWELAAAPSELSSAHEGHGLLVVSSPSLGIVSLPTMPQ